MPSYKVTVIGGGNSTVCCSPTANALSQEEVEAHLNDMGGQGWNLNFVQMFPGSQQSGATFYYKRLHRNTLCGLHMVSTLCVPTI